MLCINLKNTDPFFCLATEEYLLKNFKDDIFLLWQSTDTVVVGKHQNALSEINYPFVIKHNIRVARRISGGGAVFHDTGNVNFAYIKNVPDSSKINFSDFTFKIINALKKLNINSTSSGKNDILIDGKKISGNAEHIYKNRVLHHGTLLFNSDLHKLGEALKSGSGVRYHDKAVQSRKSEVTNILPCITKNLNISDFINFLTAEELKSPDSSFYLLNESDLREINALAENKFMTWDWNFGYSPKYLFTTLVSLNGADLNIRLNVAKGIIKDAVVTGSYFNSNDSLILSGELSGKRHIYKDIRDLLEKYSGKRTIKSSDNYSEQTEDKLIFAFF